ncbi:MAG: nicotinate phosphoribosyltransferase [Planctomycetota bacterium]
MQTTHPADQEAPRHGARAIEPDDALLLTDLYQLTMARGHWRAGRLADEGVFHLYFRRAPFGGEFALAAGVSRAIDALNGLRFDADALRWLATLPRPDGQGALFEPEFLELLGQGPLALDVDAVPDGTVVLPQVPILTVRGPLWQAQLVETLLLNLVGFETLIATKAARIVHAAGAAAVLEFGARRAQGPGAALAAGRAAWIGGVAGTSNVLAARAFGIPVRGTHAHAWVQSFAGLDTNDATELAAFEAFARSMPDGCVLLVDTYDTRAGVANAIRVAQHLRARGHELAGIRLDSGDLDALSRAARAALDAAGFPRVRIVASDDLDEHRIDALVRAGAPIDVFGVGTRLVTGGAQASLGVVFKLAAVRGPGEGWRPVMKLSEVTSKRSLPGPLQATRLRHAGVLVGDHLALEGEGSLEPALGATPPWTEAAPLHAPALRGGARVPGFPTELAEARERARAELAALPASARRLAPDAQGQPAPRGAPRLSVTLSPALEARAAQRAARPSHATNSPDLQP